MVHYKHQKLLLVLAVILLAAFLFSQMDSVKEFFAGTYSESQEAEGVSLEVKISTTSAEYKEQESAGVFKEGAQGSIEVKTSEVKGQEIHIR